ncbi:hypothetical protein ACQZV8_17575 [Magnetococcales bacterium HHB-1]
MRKGGLTSSRGQQKKSWRASGKTSLLGNQRVTPRKGRGHSKKRSMARRHPRKKQTMRGQQSLPRRVTLPRITAPRIPLKFNVATVLQLLGRFFTLAYKLPIQIIVGTFAAIGGLLIMIKNGLIITLDWILFSPDPSLKPDEAQKDDQLKELIEQAEQQREPQKSEKETEETKPEQTDTQAKTTDTTEDENSAPDSLTSDLDDLPSWNENSEENSDENENENEENQQTPVIPPPESPEKSLEEHIKKRLERGETLPKTAIDPDSEQHTTDEDNLAPWPIPETPTEREEIESAKIASLSQDEDHLPEQDFQDQAAALRAVFDPTETPDTQEGSNPEEEKVHSEKTPESDLESKQANPEEPPQANQTDPENHTEQKKTR